MCATTTTTTSHIKHVESAHFNMCYELIVNAWIGYLVTVLDFTGIAIATVAIYTLFRWDNDKSCITNSWDYHAGRERRRPMWGDDGYNLIFYCRKDDQIFYSHLNSSARKYDEYVHKLNWCGVLMSCLYCVWCLYSRLRGSTKTFMSILLYLWTKFNPIQILSEESLCLKVLYFDYMLTNSLNIYHHTDEWVLVFIFYWPTSKYFICVKISTLHNYVR